MRYILFGCGHAGAEALLTLGKNNVEYFCDNSCAISGNVAYGKPVITFIDFLDKYQDYIVVITANNNNGDEISSQLESHEIWDYVFYYDEIKNYVGKNGQKETLKYLGKKTNRQKFKADHYKELLREKREQVNYLMEWINPCCVGAGQGYIKAEQSKSLQLAREVILLMQKLNISVFAVGGTLVGALRHNGFVPWDDDIDFGIMRPDLKKLMDYIDGKYLIYERCESGVGNYRSQNIALRIHQEELVFEKSPYCLSVLKGSSIADYAVVDLFTFDYFKNDYDYNDYRELIISTKRKTEETNDEKERLIIEEAEVLGNRNICNKSRQVSFALDSMMAYDHLHNSKWIPSDVIFPTGNVNFENTFLPVPAQPEIFIDYDIPNYQTAPDDMGLSHRIMQRNRYIREILPSIEFYIEGIEDIDLFYHPYMSLRKNGVFALYVVEKDYLYRRRKRKNAYEDIVKKLRKYEVEFSIRHNANTTLGVVRSDNSEGGYLYKHIHEYCYRDVNHVELENEIFKTLKGLIVSEEDNIIW
ncbi:MAG: LicD family protein [Oribacterium sp.]|nr:LicD family protein [Oribacterium sp.]